MGLEIQILNASSSNEIHAAFATIARERPDALFLGADPLWTLRRVQLATLAVRHALPMACQARWSDYDPWPVGKDFRFLLLVLFCHHRPLVRRRAKEEISPVTSTGPPPSEAMVSKSSVTSTT
jgi:hypothetical protein